ncbi:AlpA family transcriptional regulator [Pseudomonas sp. TMW 2.1634]|uniref:helix-turn-helix transcriptional regulator n=1 Tax=Pseudomonas sp. TMW 2.1634 TaxID=1886807 RepID=UPI000E764BBF|nr:transcriptional regulator [Pseudomonas sp. TMW 2.1634]AOA06893.1 transcriptional regulator [Pseudomonas sp. TMW 2.1634]
MHPNKPHSSKGLIRQPALCQWLDVTRSGLAKLRAKDSTFPKPIKDSDSRQAAAYYVVAEVEAWLQSKIDARDKAQSSQILDAKQ